MNEEVPSRGLSVLLFVAAIKKVGEAAGDIVHFSLLGGNITVAVHIEDCKEIKPKII